MSSLRIAVLCSDDAHHKYLAALLCQRFDLAAVVVEPGSDQTQRLRKRGRYRDWFWWSYHGLRRRVLGLNRYRRRYFANAPEVPSDKCGVKPIVVDNINRRQVAQLLRGIHPAVTVIMGTTVLRKRVLKAAGPCVINIHGGFLPYYRGNHCFFFALYEGAFEHLGASLHFVDSGVDSGDLIEVVVPPLKLRDNAEHIYCRAEMLAVHRLVEILELVEAGEEIPRKPQVLQQGRQYWTRDRKPHHDLILTWRRFCARSKLLRPLSSWSQAWYNTVMTQAERELVKDGADALSRLSAKK